MAPDDGGGGGGVQNSQTAAGQLGAALDWDDTEPGFTLGGGGAIWRSERSRCWSAGGSRAGTGNVGYFCELEKAVTSVSFPQQGSGSGSSCPLQGSCVKKGKLNVERRIKYDFFVHSDSSSLSVLFKISPKHQILFLPTFIF